MTEVYKNFADVYDIFMQDTPYDEWVDYLEEVFKRNGLKPELILELGCGTGNITKRLAERGYDMIGLDISAEMLSHAREKCQSGVLFLQQDMRLFELYGTVDCVICLCDGINYILEQKELEKICILVDNYLNPGGLFIFDINTEYVFKWVLGNNTFSEAYETAAYIWDNYYDDESCIHEYTTDFFIRGNGGERYLRFTEIHYEKAHKTEAIKSAVSVAGLELLQIYDACSFAPPHAKSERLHFICRKGEK